MLEDLTTQTDIGAFPSIPVELVHFQYPIDVIFYFETCSDQSKPVPAAW